MTKKLQLMQEHKVFTVSGKRKTAIAKATIREGSGIVRINSKPIELFNYFQQLSLQEPIHLAKKILGHFNFDIEVNVRGSGTESRIQASRLAIARALVAFTVNEELKNAFLQYDRLLLVADTRRKEQRKPNDSKARAKRQKSYR